MKFSIMIGIKDDLSFLEECLYRIKNENADYEMLFIADALDDPAVRFVRAANNDRYKIFLTERKLIKVMNSALDFMTGDMFIFFGADDWIKPGTLKLVEKKVENYDMLIGGYIEVDKYSREFRRNVINENKPRLALTPSTFIRKSFMDKINLRFDERFPLLHDYEFMIRARRYANCNIIKDLLIECGFDENSRSRSKDLKLERYLELKKIKEHIRTYV